MIKFLIEHLHMKADPHVANLAAQNGHLDTLKYLVSSGIMPTNEAFEVDNEDGNVEVMKYLIYDLHMRPTEKNADEAAEYGRMDIIEFFIKFNVFPTAFGLRMASRKGYHNLVKYVTNHPNNIDDITINMVISQTERSRNDVIAALVKHNGDMVNAIMELIQ